MYTCHEIKMVSKYIFKAIFKAKIVALRSEQKIWYFTLFHSSFFPCLQIEIPGQVSDLLQTLKISKL